MNKKEWTPKNGEIILVAHQTTANYPTEDELTWYKREFVIFRNGSFFCQDPTNLSKLEAYHYAKKLNVKKLNVKNVWCDNEGNCFAIDFVPTKNGFFKSLLINFLILLTKPNTKKSVVLIGSVIDSPEFHKNKGNSL